MMHQLFIYCIKIKVYLLTVTCFACWSSTQPCWYIFSSRPHTFKSFSNLHFLGLTLFYIRDVFGIGLIYARLVKSSDGSVVTNIINSTLSIPSNSQQSSRTDSIRSVPSPTFTNHSAISNPHPMITMVSSTPNNNQ